MSEPSRLPGLFGARIREAEQEQASARAEEARASRAELARLADAAERQAAALEQLLAIVREQARKG
jgi:hypothetical protein